MLAFSEYYLYNMRMKKDKGGRPPNTERNLDLVKKRLENPTKWTFQELADFYKIKKETAWGIFDRDKNKLG